MQFDYQDFVIKTNLRRDYYEYFPHFEDVDLWNRLKIYPEHIATMLNVQSLSRLATQFSRKDAVVNFLSSPFDEQRLKLCEILSRVGISSKTIAGIGRVKREVFCPSSLRPYSYTNESLQFDSLSCVSAPGLVGLMIDALDVERGHLILDIGSGSGYHAACISESVDNDCHIYGVELNPEYFHFGQDSLSQLKYSNIQVINKDICEGLESNILFDRIYIAASFFDGFPEHLLNHLKDGGLIQFVRAISQEEFNSEPSNSWLKKTFTDYDGYMTGNWRLYTCLVTAKKMGEAVLEESRLYDVTFTPLHSDVSAYTEYLGDRFAMLHHLV
jgi:protein-L-isoaspartate(D-aspartate) O-methyltransferase